MKPYFVPHMDFDMEWIGGDRFANREQLTYFDGVGNTWAVPVLVRDGKRLGFVHDGGSIPLFAVPFVGDRTSVGFLAFVLHDWLYVSKQVSRAKADGVLLEALGACGMSAARARTIWLAVRMAGWSVWNRRGPLDLAAITAQNPGPHFRLIDVYRLARVRERMPSSLDRVLARLTLRGVKEAA